jgi:hypothetical protein
MLILLALVLAIACLVLYARLALEKSKVAVMENSLKNEEKLKAALQKLNAKLKYAADRHDRLDILRDDWPYIRHLMSGEPEERVAKRLERRPKRLLELEKMWSRTGGWPIPHGHD